MRSGLAVAAAMLLAACVPLSLPSAAVRPTPTEVAIASGRPSATPVASAVASPDPTVVATPTPTPDPGAMDLEVTSCNGGTVLRWSASRHAEFDHYIGLRSPERDIAEQYPPIAPAVDWGDLYVTDRFVTSGHDATVVPSDTEWYYRVVAYDTAGRPVSRSNVASGKILPFGDLGELVAEPVPEGSVRLSWEPFDGDLGCFSSYRVLQGTAGLAGTLLTSISDPERTEIETAALHPGVTYTLRVQAVRTTTLGHFVVAESGSLTLTVPMD